MNQNLTKSMLDIRSLGVIAGCGVALMSIIGCAPHSVKVVQYGHMQDVLGGGAASARSQITLAEALNRPHAYAVGAMEGLEGEITILDGGAWIARSVPTGLHVDGPTTDMDQGAAMLTVAHVDRWDEVKIEEDLAREALEQFVADQARQRGIDTRRPFPFLIEGQVNDLQAHVVNGICPMKHGVRLTADQRPWRHHSDTPKHVRIVGFYAADSVGNMTHPGTSVHAHALFDVKGITVTGHVERVDVACGSTLRLPKLD